jgi:hypothetical protein
MRKPRPFLGVLGLVAGLGLAPAWTLPEPAVVPAVDASPAPQVKTALPVNKGTQVKKDSVIGVRLDRAVTTETAHIEDKVTARIVRDVIVDDRTVIAAGARLEGTVVVVERGLHPTDRGRLGIKFTTLVLANNKRVPIQADTIFREADPPDDPATMGASSALGALLSSQGRRGAGTPPTGPTFGDRREVRIPAGAQLTVKLTAAINLNAKFEQ